MFVKKYKNIVIKVGSNAVRNMIVNGLLQSFVCDIKELQEFSNITIVTSGAIATAREFMKISRPSDISQKQALSAMGQVQLMSIYFQEFQKQYIKIGQILLTHADINNQHSLVNLKSTINALRNFNAIPILNENDAIATDEIKIGDNDTLSAHIACAINADLLIILTDVDGVYNKNPNKNSDAKLVTHTGIMMEEVASGNQETEFGTGGIATKIHAGNIAVKNGFDAIITNGYISNPIKCINDGKCTIFSKSFG